MHPFLSRRQLLKGAAAGAAALFVADLPLFALQGDTKGTYPFSLPKLPYAFDALEPHIDARTMEIHHDKHHQAYVTNLNAALKDHTDLQGKTLMELLHEVNKLPEAVRGAVRNNGGGHLNHSLFWQMMAKKGGEPKGALASAIDSDLGGLKKFQEAFKKAALGRFGSGWAWLVVQKGKLAVVSTANQDSPAMGGVVGVPHGVPVLGLDVWEHAYYLKYQNKRADYVDAWWHVVNWDDAAERYNAAMKG